MSSKRKDDSLIGKVFDKSVVTTLVVGIIFLGAYLIFFDEPGKSATNKSDVSKTIQEMSAKGLKKAPIQYVQENATRGEGNHDLFNSDNSLEITERHNRMTPIGRKPLLLDQFANGMAVYPPAMETGHGEIVVVNTLEDTPAVVSIVHQEHGPLRIFLIHPRGKVVASDLPAGKYRIYYTTEVYYDENVGMSFNESNYRNSGPYMDVSYSETKNGRFYSNNNSFVIHYRTGMAGETEKYSPFSRRER